MNITVHIAPWFIILVTVFVGIWHFIHSTHISESKGGDYNFDITPLFVLIGWIGVVLIEIAFTVGHYIR